MTHGGNYVGGKIGLGGWGCSQLFNGRKDRKKSVTSGQSGQGGNDLNGKREKGPTHPKKKKKKQKKRKRFWLLMSEGGATLGNSRPNR